MLGLGLLQQGEIEKKTVEETKEVSSTPNNTLINLCKKFDKRMPEMESNLKSLTVNTQWQGLNDRQHNRDLRCKKLQGKGFE